jgi:hypothetical protein
MSAPKKQKSNSGAAIARGTDANEDENDESTGHGVKEVTVGPLNGNSETDKTDSNNGKSRVVYTLFEQIQNFNEHTGSMKTLSLHATKDAAVRAMCAQFDHNAFPKNEYNLSMEYNEKPAIVDGAPLRNFSHDGFYCKVNAAGDPVHLSAYDEESGKYEKLSIREKTIKGPFASTFFDLKLVADLVILHTGITRVLADIIAEYATHSLLFSITPECMRMTAPSQVHLICLRWKAAVRLRRSRQRLQFVMQFAK